MGRDRSCAGADRGSAPSSPAARRARTPEDEAAVSRELRESSEVQQLLHSLSKVGRREAGREWMETSEVKHNHPPDTDPGGIWDHGKGRDREKDTVITCRNAGKACNCFFFFPPQTKNVPTQKGF